MRRTLIAVAGVGAVSVTALGIWLVGTSTAQTRQGAEAPVINNGNGKPGNPLPINKVILFSSGVGYFQREGEVEGSSRVDLTFPGTDVNDLLKSLVLQDSGGGKVSTISYDSPDPIEKTLKSFALDLTMNPSFGQLINQARGEKIEVTLQQSNATQPGTVSGVVLGMESQRQPHGKDALIDVEMLNMLCTEGVRSIPLNQVLRLRFLNSALDAELRRALEVLASRHDSQKKVVSLTFNGEGKRNVKVGYVIENPIWKTSYRLVIDEAGKAVLQGWAVVENTSDDDWKDVKMSLVSGRPISFQMNLYDPLFVPRPKVEPELFASLRPPTFNGALNNPGQPGGVQGGNGGQISQQPGFPGQGGNFGYMNNDRNGAINRYNFQQNLGNTLFNNGDNNNSAWGANPAGQNKISFEELQQRRQQQQAANKERAKNLGTVLALNPREGFASVASAEEIGDYFQYVIDNKVTLPRQKSALLPIVDKTVEAEHVSIFNESVQSKFPLLGMKFKNTSGQNLMQGPITIFDGGTYSGDARVADLQPDETRLIAYAIDQGTEVKAETDHHGQHLTAVKVVKGVMHATQKLRETKKYTVKNRSPHERTLVIEHPVRSDFKLMKPEKADEQSRDVYRFEVKVPAGKTIVHEVVEEQTRVDQLAINANDENTTRIFLNSTVTSVKVKDALQKAIALQGKLNDTRTELAKVREKLKAVTEDQARVRANFDKLPRDSEPYKRYLKKIETLEDEIEKYQAEITKGDEAQKVQEKELMDYLVTLNVE
jgi:hypothetical protein